MRLREIDFLRGLAILLVLFRHDSFIPPLTKVGWVGVDLFFVLSGFLVAGLLFQEYRNFNTIDPGRFLIRRGLKIYPLFYLYLSATVLIEQLLYYGVNKKALVSDVFFIQSYHPGVWPHTWSLAVEEHFYVFLTLLMLFLVKTNRIGQSKNFIRICLGTLLFCLLFRIYTVISFAYSNLTHHFATHLRMDSLFFGVLVAYFYYFKQAVFFAFFQRNRKLLYGISACLLLPVIVFPEEHPFTNTMGLTLNYISFGTILSLFLTDRRINLKLNALLGKPLINFISFTGTCSYSIYLFHFPIRKYILAPLELDGWVGFVTYFFGSIALGIFISKTVEQRIMVLKNNWFPKKATAPVVVQQVQKLIVEPGNKATAP